MNQSKNRRGLAGRSVSQRVFKGLSAISLISLVFYTTLIGVIVAPVSINAEAQDVSGDPSYIKGLKFEDINGNGEKDHREHGLKDWTIQLWAQCNPEQADYNEDGNITLADAVSFTEPYKAEQLAADLHPDESVNTLDYDCMNSLLNNSPVVDGWYVVRTDTTNGNGHYMFNQLKPGQYRVSEVQQDGWVKTLPASEYYSVTIDSNDHITGKNFGNRNFRDAAIVTTAETGRVPLFGLHGYKWNDVNGNGLWDCPAVGIDAAMSLPTPLCEELLPGWTIELRSICDEQAMDYTDNTASGSPDGLLTLADGSVFTQYFQDGNPLADINHDGDINEADQACANDGYGDGNVDTLPSSVLQTTLTANEPELGWYWFEGLAAGSYAICEALQPGWVQTFPMSNGGCHLVTLPNTSPLTENAIVAPEYDFGNQRQLDICTSPLDYNHADGAPGPDGVLGLSDATRFTELYQANNLQADVNGNEVVDYGDKLCAEPYYGNNNYVCEPGCAPYTPVCGDTHIDSQMEEQCDDGNLTNGDGCSATCQNEQVLTPASLEISKADGQETAKAGDVLTYTITVKNSGDLATADVKVTDNLPGYLTTITDISDGGQRIGAVVRWDNLTIAGHSSKVLTYKATVDPALAPGSYVIHNTATLGCSTAVTAECPFALQTADDTGVTAEPISVIALAKTDAADPVSAGSNITYTLTYTVSGKAVTGLTLVDPLPANTSFVSASDSGTYSAATRTVTWLLGSKAPGTGSVTLVIAAPSPIANGTVMTNTASLDSNETDPASATQTTTVASTPALAIEKSADVVVTNPGKTVTYTVKVSNNGTDSATDVTLSDVLPTGFTMLGTGQTSFSVKLGTIAAGSSVTTTYQAVSATGLANGPYTNTASAQGSNTPAISVQTDVMLRTPVVLGTTTPGPEPEVLGAELANTGTGLLDYLVALMGLITLALGIKLTLPIVRPSGSRKN